ncbi:MAG TPA: LptA/OstA family protein, partial [Candidatus Obscuribacterales bacterium]
ADKLTFEIASQKVVAEGNAHSEVQGQSEAANSPSDKGAGISKPAPGEKIITDSDRQEYDKSADKFEALGNVRVKHGDIFVTANKLQLVYGVDKKPETAVFTGNVVATQGQNKTTADMITYSLPTKRLQATGHVKSQVIQPRKADGSKKGDLLSGESGPGTGGGAPGTGAIASSGSGATGAGGQLDDSSDPIIITSDAQDYSQDTRRMSAEGNVRVYYQDTVGMGPKVILLRNEDGKADKVIFSGRSQVSQPGRRWIADRITVTVADKRVLAEGNTKALIIQQPSKAPNRTPAPAFQLAGRGNAISSKGIEAPQ